ncbi:MAG: Type IV secretory pathway VirB4 component-like protein [Microgenomates group bacterium GW2011_GWA1_48_10]|nr:MAG: Type IV secretory pathway VirB4 component-like protein [Microgenomates group bacterium GW2011_GWA1_48_10]
MNIINILKPQTKSPEKVLTDKEKQWAESLAKGVVSVKDIIAPPAIEVDFDYIKIGSTYYRTLFVVGYPRYVQANWLSPLINFVHTLEISMYQYPVEAKGVLDDLKRKVTEMEATIASDIQHGHVLDPAVQAALEDAQFLQDELVRGQERFFQFGLYVTIPADSKEELDTVSKQVESTMGALLLVPKHATLQMEDAFKTTLPQQTDHLYITRNMDTTSLASTFPFISSSLTSNTGIMYGINEHNGSLVIFDRFTQENANSVIFAKSGAGKSYLVKLEALRSLMFGTEIVVIDPEEEYKNLCESIGGEYITFSFDSSAKINPFDLSGVYEEGENELGLKILSLHGFFKVVMGNMSPSEDAVLDRAIVDTYRQKGITPDPATQKNEPPLMEDLYKVLLGMEEAEAKSLADRIEKFVKGSLIGIFNQQSNIDLRNTFTVFSVKSLEEELRPIAMYLILDFIWTRIKNDVRKRLLIVDEAWYMMQFPDSATFLYSVAKRARKYYLGLTTISQDVEDFLNTDYGKAIVTNSSFQILLKQSPAAIDKVAEVFYLSEGERHLLLAADVGEGIFFAGPNHVAVRIIASPEEHSLVTTNPEELKQMEQDKQEQIVRQFEKEAAANQQNQ